MAVNPNEFADAIKKSAGIKTDSKAPQKGASKTTAQPEAPKNVEDFATAIKQSAFEKKKEPAGESLPPGAEAPTSKLPSPSQSKFDFDSINQRSGILSKEEAERQAEQQQIADKSFTPNDATALNDLLGKHEIFDPNNPFPNARNLAGLGNIPNREPEVSKRPYVKEFENAGLVEQSIKNKLAALKEKSKDRVYSDAEYAEKKKLENDLIQAENLKKKSYRELTIEGTAPVDAIVRTDESGNLLNKTFNRLLAANPTSIALGGAAMSMETQDRFNKLPSQFATGLNYLKGIEPVIYERLTNSIAKGEPISETQIASITAQGLDIEQERLRRDMEKAAITAKPDADKLQMMGSEMTQLKNTIDGYEEKVKSLQLSVPEIADYKEKINQYNSLVAQAKPLQEKLSAVNNIYTKRAEELAKVRKSNLLDNKEVLRSFLSEGIAEIGDQDKEMISDIKKKLAPSGNAVSDYLFGHTWNYSEDDIKFFAEKYAKQNGLDPASPQVQDAIKYLQDNEGAMIMQNSIAKAGGIREFGKGLADPIRQTFNSLEDLGKKSAAVYAESQSLGSTNVSESRLKKEDTGVRGVLNDVIKGSGQFLTQAGLMYAAGVPVAGAGEALLGRAGVAALEGDIAFGDMAAKDLLGKALYKGKNPIAVFTSSYAMAYDSNLKQALNYTSDNTLAKRAAAINSAMEGATELFLSPLEIAEGIVHKFSKGQTTDLLKILSDKSLKNDPSKLRQYVEKGVKGILGTAKVAGAEIGEELVSQISDYVTNMYLNPNSESFKNRDLLQEFGTTAYQTGLTMAVPALLNGIGAMRANTFTKGSLMVAAQNRQKMFDAYKKDLAEGKIDQNTFNTNVSLLNTAAQANDELPKKADGTSLTTDEKANYIFSRVTEAVMQKKLNSLDDAAQKQILNKKIVEQQNYRAKILGNEEITTDPSYKVDGNEVSKNDFIRIAKSENADDYNFQVSNDEETQALLRKIGGVDEEEAPPEQQKADDLELLTTLKGKETVPSFEYNGIIANPDLAYREIADQALGFTRKGDERVPHEFGGQEDQAREKYGDVIVDRAIELYPAEEVAKDSGITGIDHEEIKRQMQPITDKMADIEREFKNNGLEIDWDYDNEITVTDKDGNIVDPSEIPDALKKQAANYEKATQTLADFSPVAYVESLKESRKKITGEDVKIKYGGTDKDLEGNPQKQWMKPMETSEQATNRLAEFVEASDYKGREQSTFIDRKGESIEVKLRNDDGKWNWYEPKSKKPFASFDNAKDAIKFIQEQPFWDNGELNKYGRNDAYFAKVKADHIKTELENGNIIEDINDGKISKEDAVKIIKSAGLEVPKDILELEDKSEQPNIKEQEPQPKKSSKLAKFKEKHLTKKEVEPDEDTEDVDMENQVSIKTVYQNRDEVPVGTRVYVPQFGYATILETADAIKFGTKDGIMIKLDNPTKRTGETQILWTFDNLKIDKNEGKLTPEEEVENAINGEYYVGDEQYQHNLQTSLNQIKDIAGREDDVARLTAMLDYLKEKRAAAELANKEVSEKVAALEAEKQQKLNEITKPEISFETGLSLNDLARTTELNRQQHDDIKAKLAILKNIINCLWL